MINSITAEAIRKAKGQGITALTAYDYPTARLLDEAGIEVILVGDSLGMVVLGLPDTTGVVLEDILHHLRAVRRGAKHALVTADLPFGTYRNPQEAVGNARRLADAGADAVKLEGGSACEEQIRAITTAGIPLMAHLGMLPQHIREEGGYKIKGKEAAGREFLLEEARAVERAGAFSAVLELVFPETASEITRTIGIPTIGIGSGSGCDGQILVIHDLVGYTPWFVPKHVRPEAEVGNAITGAAKAFITRVKSHASKE